MIAIGEYTISALNDLDYYEVTSSDSMVVIEDENFTPEAVTFTSKHRLGNGNLEAYSGRFKIETSKDGETWETKYTSSGNESAVEYELPSALEDKVPYLFRKSVGGDRAIEEIVGGSVVWNQTVDSSTVYKSTNEIELSEDNGTYTYTTNTQNQGIYFKFPTITGHTRLVVASIKTESATNQVRVDLWGSGSHYIQKSTTWQTISFLFVDGSTREDNRLRIFDNRSSDWDAVSVKNVMTFDLTTMFGSTAIVDYIYNLEQQTAGSGIAKLKSWGFFTKDYYPYCLPTIRSVSGLVEKRYVGFNQLNPANYVNGGSVSNYNKSVGWTLATGSESSVSGSNPISIAPTVNWRGSILFSDYLINGQAYCLSYRITGSNLANIKRSVYFVDDNNVVIQHLSHASSVDQNIDYVYSATYTPTADNLRMAIVFESSTPQTIEVYDLCVNISDSTKNGTYEPYEVNTYSLDSSLELRGIFKLDSDNNLYADGDVYSSDGKVENRYDIVDLGTLNWGYKTSGTSVAPYFWTDTNLFPNGTIKYVGNWASVDYPILCSNYIFAKRNSNDFVDKRITVDGAIASQIVTQIQIKDSSYTDAASFKTAMSGIYLLYELAEPTTFTALPYHNPQEFSEYGTEEFVTTGIIPVGHNTKYPANIKNIRCSLYKPNETPSATTLLDQITVPIVSGLQYQPFVQRTVFEWALSSSSTELDENTTWAEQKPKPTQAQPYLWERSRNDYSNGTHTYSDAHCDVTISGVISDVDKINGQITNKVWQSDITTSINSYDGTTVSNIRDRVSTTEQNLTGITTRVGAVESTTGSLGTRMTAAESSISQNADNIELKVSKDGVISSINQSSESITISADKVNIAGSTAFTSLNSQVTAIQNETNQKSELIRGTQTAATYSWTGTSTTILQLTDGMEIRYWLPFSVGGGTVSGSYSYYDGSKTTTGTNTGVGLTLTLKDGTMTEEIPVYYGSMTRLTSHYGYGNIIRMVYRENVRVNNGNSTYYTVAKGFWCDANYNANSNYVQYSTAVTSGANNGVYQYSLIMRDSANTWVSIATSDGTGTSKSVYTGGLYYDKVLYHDSGTNYASNKTTRAVYDSIAFDLRYSTNCGTTLTTRKPVYLVGTINNTDKRFYLDTTQWWTQTVPTSADGKTYIYIGEAYSSYQVWLATENKAYQYYNGRFITLEEIKDLEAMTWINSTGQNAADIIANWATDATSATTTINGGLIQTHTIQSSHLATNAIMSNNYQASQNAGSPYSVTGSFLDLDNGNFYTPNFGLDNVNGNAYFNGEITAISGQIGDDTSNHWQIGTVVDFNGNQSAAIESNGTSYIQSGDWMISNNRIDTRHYDNQRKYTYLYEDGVYWDFGLHTPSLTSNNDYENNFIYIRNHESTIPTLEGAWNYVFRVDRNGMIYINGVSLDEKYASIDGVSGAYLPMTGGNLTGNLSVGGNLTVTGTVSGLKNLSINGKTYNGSSAVTVGTIGAAYGGTGQTSLVNSANALINALDTGSSTPVDNDYYISQYVNGGTTTKTYHRRPMSALWLYIKGKINADTDLYTDKFVPKTGGEFTGAVTVSDALIADEITSGNLIVNGVGRFTNGIYGDLTGNASTATVAAKVADSGNGQATTFAYSKTGLSTTSWFAAWDGYELKKISSANVLSTIGGQPAGNYLLKTGDTMTGVLNIVGQMENAYVGISNSNYSMRLGIGNGGTNRGLWDMNLNKWVLYSDASASYFNGNATSATSATTATKFSSNRTIQLTGDVTGSASSNGEGGWSIATTVGNDSHSHTPDTLYIPSDFGKTGSLDLISGSKVGSYMSNKSFAIPPEAVTIEYSTDNGSTWKDYEATDSHKKGLFSETRYGCHTHLGKATTKEANSINNQLRITISRINLGRYCAVDSFYTWMTTNGNTVYCKLEYSTNSNPTTFQTLFTDFQLRGWSGHNIKYFSEKELGGSNNGQVYAYRLTVWQTAINTDYPSADLYDIRFFGRNTYGYDAPYYKLQTNELYTWDNNLNATFPAQLTATQFNGNATSASKLNSTRSFTIGKTAKNVDWSGAVSFSQAEISDNASTSAAGWMSKDDKTKLNGIEANAQVNTITGVKGNSETTYRTGDVNITASNIGLGNLTNNKQVKGLSSGTTSGHLVTWGSDGYTVADSGIAKGSVTTKITLSGSDYSASSNTITITKANLQSAVQDTDLVLMTSAERTKLDRISVAEGGTIDFSGVTASAPLTATVDQTTKAVNITHNTSGVAQGTYRSVTVNTYGHVTAGTNPTTLSGYGITDAKIASGVITLGSNTITPLTASSTLDATKLSGMASIDTTGNAATTTEFSSNASVTLTGDTTGTASSKKGWSITTTTSQVSNQGRIASADLNKADGKLRAIIASSSMTTGKPPADVREDGTDSNSDAVMIDLPWDNTGWGGQLAVNLRSGTLFSRSLVSGTYNNWKKTLNDYNYTDYTVTKTGTGASGTWGINITGNAATANSATSATTATTANSATKATQDGDGNTISSTYLKLSGGTVTGITKFDKTIRDVNGQHYYGGAANRSQWYKITLAHNGVTPPSSNQWYMCSMTLHVAGDYNYYPKGSIELSYYIYWNGTKYIADKVFATGYGPNINKAKVYYNLTNPFEIYVDTSGAYTTLWVDYVSYRDSAQSHNTKETKVETASAITVADYLQVPMSSIYTYDGSGLFVDSAHLLPSVTNTDNLGSSTYKWANVYATTFNGDLSGNATSANKDGDGNTISSTYLKLSGGTMTGDITFNSEKIIKYKIPRKSSNGGGWVYEPMQAIGNDNNTFGRIGFSGNNDTFDYMYLGSDSYFSNNNLKIYPNGTVQAVTFSGNLTGTATKATQDGDGNTISSTYLKLSGGTMTGTEKFNSNFMSLNFRADNTSYTTGLFYGTNGNEALALATKNAVTSFMVVHGSDPTTWNTSTWTNASPTLQTKNNSLYVHELIPSGTTPAYNFKVNGTSYLGGNVRISDTNADTASCEMQYNRDLQCLEFIFN